MYTRLQSGTRHTNSMQSFGRTLASVQNAQIQNTQEKWQTHQFTNSDYSADAPIQYNPLEPSDINLDTKYTWTCNAENTVTHL